MKKLLLIMLTAAISLSCQKQKGEESEQANISIDIAYSPLHTITDVNLYCFNQGGELYNNSYFATLKSLEAETLTLNKGIYTFITIMNIGDELAHPLAKTHAPEKQSLMISDFIAWIKSSESQYPNMLTGLTRKSLDGTGGIGIEVETGSKNLDANIVRLNLAIDNGTLPDYTARVTKTTREYDRRAVVEF